MIKKVVFCKQQIDFETFIMQKKHMNVREREKKQFYDSPNPKFVKITYCRLIVFHFESFLLHI
jgi:hypothetical protein